jgi:hypothetical protein
MARSLRIRTIFGLIFPPQNKVGLVRVYSDPGPFGRLLGGEFKENADTASASSGGFLKYGNILY